VKFEDCNTKIFMFKTLNHKAHDNQTLMFMPVTRLTLSLGLGAGCSNPRALKLLTDHKPSI
jgi:hypothetical protein